MTSTSTDSRRERVQTFYGRRGRMGPRRRDALTRLLPVYGVDVAGDRLDPADVFGRHAPLVLEIGPGSGEATAQLAAADPDRDHLAAEVHAPGVSHLLQLVEQRNLTNVRVAHGDALELIDQRIAPDSLDAIRSFFPDPWPKARHHKRRLFQPAHVALLRSRLRPGGMLHTVTDWAEYAQVIHDTLSADPELADARPHPPPPRPPTRYERRAIAAGRPVIELVFRRSLR